jgi:signal transduction histidine kinase/ligand-binding sensor domain-containing protein
MLHRRTLLLFLTLALLAPRAVLPEQLPTIVFPPRDGLDSTVARMVVDSRGFIWFIGSEGLACFDGNKFRAFTEADGLPAGSTFDIVERRDGTYWVAVQDQLCRFDPRPGAKRFHCEPQKLGVISALLESEGTLWCATATGLWRRPAAAAGPWESVRAIEPSATGGSSVHRLLRDARGDVWATAWSGLYRFRSSGRVDRWTPAEGLLFDQATALSETPGAVWVGSQDVLLRLEVDPATGDARIADRYDRSHGLPSGYVVDVRSWRGSVWAATFQGLARQLSSGRWETVRLDPSVSGIPLASLAVDRLGSLWVGTDGAGAARVSGSGFSSFSEQDGLGLRRVWAVFEDRSGNLMAVTKDEANYFLNRFDGHRFHAIRPRIPLANAWGWSWSQIAVHSRSGEWWLATGQGLLRYATGLDSAPSLVGRESDLPEGSVFRVFEDSGGGVWVSIGTGSNYGLYRRDPRTGRFARFDESYGLPPLHLIANRPAAFAEDRAGQLWIGMLNGGLVRFRSGAFQQLPAASGAPVEGVRALLVDRAGRLWVGTRTRGLLRVDDPSNANPVFTAYSRPSGLSSITVLALAEDLEGRIYAGSGSGIERLDPATGRIRRFTTSDGLLPGDLRVAFRDRNGALWFGGDQGLIRIEPQEERIDSPVVLVHSIRVNGRVRPISDVGDVEPAPLSLAPSERQLQVEFGGFRRDLLYQTRLSGVDADWTAPSPERTVHYLSLAPGSYRLSIRAVAPDGSASSRPAELRFRIAPPLWQRWWFFVLAAASLAGAAYALYRYRVSRLLELERVRTRIASDLHDDIGAGLSRIAVLSEVARHEAGGGPSAVTDHLAVISRASRELVDSMSDIVWVINPERDQLRDLVQRMRRFASDVFTSRGVEFTFRAPGDEQDLKVGAAVRRHVLLIFKESVNNIVRHSGCAKSDIELRVEGSWFILTVADDGRGFDPAQANEGNGLVNMRERARMLGGELRVASGLGQGTTSTLRVPLGAAVKERGSRLRGSRGARTGTPGSTSPSV